MIGASRSTFLILERSLASSWQARHHELSPSRQRRLAGNSSVAFCSPQWRQVFIRPAAPFHFLVSRLRFSSFSRECLALGSFGGPARSIDYPYHPYCRYSSYREPARLGSSDPFGPSTGSM